VVVVELVQVLGLAQPIGHPKNACAIF
jgi:hypothetical protein